MESWSHLIEAEDEEQRLQGLKLAVRVDGHDPREILIRMMGDASWRVRKEAADQFLIRPDALGRAGEIVRLLYDDANAGQRNTAAEVLIRMGEDAVPALLAEMDSEDHDVRKFLVDIFGAIGGEAALQPLIAKLQDEDVNVAAAAAENLGRMEAKSAVPQLLDCLGVDDLMFRFTLLEALAQIGEPIPADRLLDFEKDAVLRKALYDCLGHVATAEVVPVLQSALIENHGPIAASALKAMARIGNRLGLEAAQAVCHTEHKSLLDKTAGFLQDRDEETRQAALSVLGWCDDGSHALLLLPLLHDFDLRDAAFAALIHVCQKDPCFLLSAWDDQDDEVKVCLALVFGEGRCEQSRSLLEETVVTSSGELQLAAAAALEQLGTEESLPKLIEACRLADSADRFSLAGSTGRLGTHFPEEAARLAQSLLEDHDEDLRACAVEILAPLTGGSVSQALEFALKDPSSQVRSSALRALSGRLDEESRGAVMLALTDEDADVRRLATELLGEQGGADVVEPLSLALQDEDIWVRSSAVRSLGRAGGAAAFEAIRGTLSDPVGVVVIHALETLVELAGEDAASDLLAALSHADQEVVSTALQLLVGLHSWEKVAVQVKSLLKHESWEVRSQAVRLVAEQQVSDWRELLQQQLEVEGEDLVRMQINDYLQGGVTG